ncbi:glycosyltransferase [Psychrobacter sp. AOP29-E1-4]|uniref:glycosyltransferase n=1 Tax=Psychrobacter sp. AOP29-E1-4 TaxID=3457703 RepID=UPI0040369679
MSDKKKICFVIPTLQMGGMERVASLLANYSVRNGYYVYIICLIDKNSSYYLDENISIFAPDFEYKKGVLNKLKVLHYLVSCLKEIKPNAVLSFSEVFNPLSIVSAKLANVPIYISDRSSPYKKLSFFTQSVRKLTYPCAKGMISQTELAKTVSLNKGYNDNVVVIANPLREINQKLEPPKEQVIVSVGRLIPTKNFKELIDIFSEVNLEKKWQLWILGDGPDREVLQEQIDNLLLSDCVKLLGAVKDVDNYLSKASIFAFTSISEGFPNALSEAIAYPLPCIAYDCPAGPSDLIKNNKNGFLIPLHDKESFKLHLNKLMNDSFLRSVFVDDYKSHREKYHTNSISKKYLDFLLS